ncbi:MAG: hypothetical protein EOO09_06070 [Chitinophagaceae bacterium]|nr:MAG: hypothetical protein EOO09_06070 [Chitinophagaceae bacterium]
MIVKKTLGIKAIYQFAGHHLLWLTAWMAAATALFHLSGWRWMLIPPMALTLIGTAVAFYVGFKNNQAYDRLWEARRVWGSIINNSRMLGTMVKNFIGGKDLPEEDRKKVHTRIIHRHIAWLYTLRQQLLVPTQWEHVSLAWLAGSYNRRRKEFLLTNAYKEEMADVESRHYLESSDQSLIAAAANKATQINDLQSAEIAALYREGQLNMMQQVELQRIVNSFYDEQGKAERIKRYPFPRQYGSFSFVFVAIFVFFLPFGLLGYFAELGGNHIWLCVPFGVVIGWVYVVMELIGDYSENPFEGLYNDIPMLSICRTIEIDLLQMFGETNVPPAIQPKNDVLM